MLGDGVSLIYAASAMAADIELLERHDVGSAPSDHLCDAPWVRATVCADASVDIIRYYPRHCGSSFCQQSPSSQAYGADTLAV
jgi:hypothetical protein